MNYSDVLFKRPEGTIISKRKDRQYVLFVKKKVYLKDKKYNQDKRVVIGRLTKDNMIIPNDKFFELFPDQIVIDKNPSEFSDTIRIGGYAVVKEVLKQTDLHSIIQSIYEEQANLIEDMIAYYILSGDSVTQDLPYFLKEHPSFASKVTSDTSAGRLLHNLPDSSIRLLIRNGVLFIQALIMCISDMTVQI